MEVTSVSMSGLNPPPPSLSDDEDNIGRRLMALVRATEKTNDDDTELRDLLIELISLYSRRGLLLGKVEKAQRVLESSSSSSSTKVRGGKRDHAHNTETSSSYTDDESLVLSALARILTPKDNSASCGCMVVALAGDVCTAITTHIQAESQTSCALAELQILLKSGQSLLTGVGSTIKSLLSISCRSVQEKLALISCLQATTSLISLLGQKVPRPTISTIRKVSWSTLIDSDAQVRQSSALLLSILPLTGANNTPPADAWSACVLDGVVALMTVLDAMAPLRKRKSKLKMLLEDTQTMVTEWINQSSGLDIEAERVEAFQSYIQGLSAYLVALLSRQAYTDTTKFLMMTAKLPVEPILNLIDSMIVFPSAAETVFFSTKKRLRLEVVNNGLLSPAAVVLEMANLVKYLGHDILDATMTAGGSSLLPFARQVMRITNASLLSSVSSALQKVLDPTKTALRAVGKRKRWLHNSVVLRTRAIKTYITVIQTLGTSVMAGSLSTNDTRGARDETQAISCIGGSLLEQLSWPEESDDDWATLSERVDLGIMALNALSTVLTIGGGYLPLAGRSLIDSIAVTCCSSIRIKLKSRAATWPSVKVEILRLGSACLCTPWPDGAMSSIMSDMRKSARACTRDSDGTVVTEATACLRLCDALSMPRVPALSIVASREHGRETRSAISLIKNLKSAREDMASTEMMVTTTKLSRPLDDSPKKVEKKLKRQKVQAAAEEENTTTSSNATKAVNKPVASSATRGEYVAHPENSQSRDTMTTEETKASPKAATAVASLPGEESRDMKALRDSPQRESVPNAEKKYDHSQNDANTTSHEAKNRAPASLKRDNSNDSDDDDLLPDIVVDGGPDEEDQ